MIEIDLLPSEMREKKKIVFGQFLQVKYIFMLLGFLILLQLLLQLIIVASTKRYAGLRKSWQGLSAQRKEIDRLKSQLSDFNKNIPLIEQLVGNRILWSKQLNSISDLLVPGIWLNEMTIQTKKAQQNPAKCLIIRGSAASRTKDEPALIGRFMQNLKADLSFSADFAEIELGPIKKKLIKQTEVMDFTLICQFKPDRAMAIDK